MKLFGYGVLALSLCAALAGSIASGIGVKKEAVFQPGDEEIILSEMPLKGFQKMGLEEWQANDLGPVFLIGVEVCNGVAI